MESIHRLNNIPSHHPPIRLHLGKISQYQHLYRQEVESIHRLNNIPSHHPPIPLHLGKISQYQHLYRQEVESIHQLNNIPSHHPSPSWQNGSVPASLVPPPFSTPPKLLQVDDVMKDYPGNDVFTLRRLATALARDAIFGKKALSKSSLSGKNNTGCLEKRKLEYIKTLVRSRVPTMSDVALEELWGKCRSSLSKSCQTFHVAGKKKLLTILLSVTDLLS